MKLSERSIKALQKVLTGDALKNSESGISPYRSCPELMEFFNEFGFNDSYSWGGGAPTRWVYAEDCLRKVNDTPVMNEVVEAAFDPLGFKDSAFDIDAAMEFMHDYFTRDGYELFRKGPRVFVRTTGFANAKTPSLEVAVASGSMDFVHEQIRKCEEKVLVKDFDGAITNARSMLEAVLIRIEEAHNESKPYAGDLPKLYKRVMKLLNVDPARSDIPVSLRQVLSGLTSIVHGVAAARNAMGDAHARSYKPAAHHARLVINAALAAADFLLASEEHQQRLGRLPERKE